MVTRKPVPNNSAVPASTIPQIQVEEPTPTQHEPPEPWETFDSDIENSDEEHHTKQSKHQDTSQAQKLTDASTQHDVPSILRPGVAPSTSYHTLEEENVWVDAGRSNTTDTGNDGRGDIERVPTILRPGSGGVKKESSMEQLQGTADPLATVPPVLRPGGGGAAKPETNPFKRKIAAHTTGPSPGEHTAPQTAPPPPPVPLPSFSQLSLAEQNNNPWQPALEDRRDNPPAPVVPPIPEQDAGNDIWNSAKPSRQTTPGPVGHSPALLSLPSEESSAGWEDESRTKPSLPGPLIPPPDQEVLEGSHAWDDLGNIDKGKNPAKPAAVISGASTGSDDWNLIDVEAPPGPPPKQQHQQPSQNTTETSSTLPNTTPNEEAAPSLPPRRPTEPPASPPPPPQPPRPVDKSETYQIKKITWHDASASKNPRISPILVQNANGPCPLVALVNALSLTTPADQTNTALVEALRSRERISLGLLLDAVFDELMSERRTKPDVALPDVAELYEFLKGLHTGMNVNPRFIPTTETITLLKRTSLSHLHPATDRTTFIPGTFESTKEMSLYATFSIPLIHGWLPAPSDAVYAAFNRQATSYEDAQNLLFREEELEEKLSSPHSRGITEEEGQIYQDILTIKSFLSISATQLTPYGLDVIRQSMKPGSVAILFRNDHFSTLYRHPDTLELLTLVTDAGYAGHDEVVWESLVDVNGERAEFFSGDFRVVGGALHGHGHGHGHGHASSGDAGVAGSSGQGGGGEWTTVQGGRRTAAHGRSNSMNNTPQQQQQHQRPNPQRHGSDNTPPLSPTHEQEDRDLALALQLQEEEDERHRAEVARRRRESQLSEQFIEQQGRPGSQPVSGGGSRGGRGGGGGSNTIAPARRSSNGVNVIPIGTSSSARGGRGGSAPRGGGGGGGGGIRPVTQQHPTQQQTVRPLVPPALPARNGNNRDPEGGLDDAPPSYEQASKQTPYVPPAGHPSHPASAPNSRNGGSTSSLPSTSAGSVGVGIGAGRGRGNGPYPGQGQGQGGRQGVRPPGAVAGNSGGGGGGRERERDCVVM